MFSNHLQCKNYVFFCPPCKFGSKIQFQKTGTCHSPSFLKRRLFTKKLKKIDVLTGYCTSSTCALFGMLSLLKAKFFVHGCKNRNDGAVSCFPCFYDTKNMVPCNVHQTFITAVFKLHNKILRGNDRKKSTSIFIALNTNFHFYTLEARTHATQQINTNNITLKDALKVDTLHLEILTPRDSNIF